MPRANLSPAKIVDEALRWVDAHGYEPLSMAGLAETLGVAAPSLYKHVASLGWLQRGVALHALRDLREVLQQAAAGRRQEDALDHLARAYRAFAKDYPGRYAAIQRAPDARDPDWHALTEGVLGPIYDMLDTYGRTGYAATHDVRLLRSALHGFVLLEAQRGFGLPLDTDESFNHVLTALDRTFRRAPP